MSGQRVKIKFRNVHLASVNRALLMEFRCKMGIVNLISWIAEQADAQYGILLRSSDDVPALQAAVKEDYYDDIGEWLQSLMRIELISKEIKKSIK